MALRTFPAPTPIGYVDVPVRWSGQTLAVHPPLVGGVPTVTRGEWAISAHCCDLRAGTFHGPLSGAVALARAWDQAFSEAVAAAPMEPAPYDRDRSVPSLNAWPQRQAWLAQLRGEAPATGPVSPDHPLWAPEPDPSPTPSRNPDAVQRWGCDPGPVPRTGTRTRVTTEDGDGGEQFPATPTLWKGADGRIKCASHVAGKKRPRIDGKLQRMNGDVAAFKGADPLTPTLKLWFRGSWYEVPSIAQIMEWSFDSIVESPDGSRVEPDAPESWLSLLGLV